MAGDEHCRAVARWVFRGRCCGEGGALLGGLGAIAAVHRGQVISDGRRCGEGRQAWTGRKTWVTIYFLKRRAQLVKHNRNHILPTSNFPKICQLLGYFTHKSNINLLSNKLSTSSSVPDRLACDWLDPGSGSTGISGDWPVLFKRLACSGSTGFWSSDWLVLAQGISTGAPRAEIKVDLTTRIHMYVHRRLLVRALLPPP